MSKVDLEELIRSITKKPTKQTETEPKLSKKQEVDTEKEDILTVEILTKTGDHIILRGKQAQEFLEVLEDDSPGEIPSD